MKNLIGTIKRNSSGKKVLILFILTNIVYAFMLMVTIPKVMSFSNGMKLLDMMPSGYSPEFVLKLLETLGTEGRNVYLFQQIPVDMVYPGLFAISYCLVLGWLLSKMNNVKVGFYYFCLIPFIAGLFDYLENLGIILMIRNYPDISDNLISATNISTIIKSTSTTIYFLVVIICLSFITWNFVFKRTNQ
ncbi:hypothetical protein ACUNWD_15490 [Sunxiuqinia sp. A32]|uniref:hypothetical protein n=1 Tax=Sunxiuqinia sp. A32 TaxID=3461496 RepID=UPI0040457315